MCVFCQIVEKRLPAKVVFEDERVLAFWDIHPKTRTHLLFIPKTHIESLESLTKEETEVLLPSLFKAVKSVTKKAGLSESGYQLRFHVLEGGGQEVMHLHLHLNSDFSIQETSEAERG